MCGRSSVSKKESELEKRFNAKFYSADVERYNPLPKYNICPTTFVPILKNTDRDNFVFMHWGLDLEGYDGKLHKNTINARKENILKIPLFKESLIERRCIVPATSYFEWKTLNKGKTKIPYLVHLQSLPIFSIAGLWVTQENELGEWIEKFVLITQEPSTKLSFIHDRMPAILTPEKEELWLSENTSMQDALSLIDTHPDTDIRFHPVSKELNKSFDNKPKFIVEQRYDVEEQGSLW